jgi:hypothetical protein
VIGDLTVVVPLVLSSFAHRPDVAGMVLLFYVVGLIVFGLPALVATVPASWLWIAILRRIVAGRAA